MKTLPQLAVLMLSVVFYGCNQATTTMGNDNADRGSQYQDELPAYDANMDLTVTGGDSVEMIGDTLGIKMYVSTIQPGDSVGWHFHPDHTVYFLEGGTLAVYFKGSDEKKIFELPAGMGIISSSLSDAAVNEGDTAIRLLTHDIYKPRVNE